MARKPKLIQEEHGKRLKATARRLPVDTRQETLERVVRKFAQQGGRKVNDIDPQER